MNKQKVKLLKPRNVFGHRLDAGSVIELPALTAQDLVNRGEAEKTSGSVSLVISGDSFVLVDGALVPAPTVQEQKEAPKARSSRKRKPTKKES